MIPVFEEIMLLDEILEPTATQPVGIRPILLETAAMSSAVDKYGMGSTKDILLNAAG